jgi:hypothetical protein
MRETAGVRYDRAERAAVRAADRQDLIRIMPAKGVHNTWRS